MLVDLGPGVARKVRIDHIHLEQDAGKSIHDLDPDLSFVDLNRTGVALMEIVSKPDIRGPEEAAEYVRKLRQILRYLGTCDGNMQEGNLRADVNVSVRRKGETELGTRCEIKNMNSMRFIQAGDRVRGPPPDRASSRTAAPSTRRPASTTRSKGETRSMRSKEEAHDYRYFPDPDLLPLELDQAWIDAIGASLPELPDAKKARFVADYGMTEYDAGVLTAETASAAYFEAVAPRPRRQAGGELGDQRALRPAQQGRPRHRRQPGRRRRSSAASSTSSPRARFPARSPRTSSRSSGPRAAIRRQSSPSGACARSPTPAPSRRRSTEVIAANPDKVAQAQAKPSLAGWFVGQVMKATGGKANPQAVNALVRAKLGIE